MLVDSQLQPFVKAVSFINSGYARCRLKNHPHIPNGYHLVHRAVWWHFNSAGAPGLIVRHKDGNRLNNQIQNLEAQSVSQHQSEANKGKPKSNGPKLIGNKNAKTIPESLENQVLAFTQEKHSAYKVGKLLGISAQKVYYIWNKYRKVGTQN